MKSKRLTSVLIPVLLLFATTTANAETQTANFNLNPGSLGISFTSNSSNFTAITLDGNDQSTTANLGDFTVTDARGTGEGWNLTVEATRMTEVGGAGLQLPSNSLELTGQSSVISTVGGSSSPVPSYSNNFDTNYITIDSGSPVKLLSAAVNEGMGIFNVALNATSLKLSLEPSTTFIDKTNYPISPTPFTTDLTWSLVSGP